MKKAVGGRMSHAPAPKREDLDPREALDILEVRARESEDYLIRNADVGSAVFEYLAEYGAPATRQAVAANPLTPARINRALAEDGEEEVRLPFLGQPAGFALGPFQLAAMLKRPVVLMVGIYQGGRRYDVHFERIADFSDVPVQDRPGLVRWAAGRFADRLEHHALSSPYNWFNFYDFWK